ncbi:hypothetical protein MBMB1_1102 [Methanobacterium sp. MB1]|jgi:glycosyltransferase involved in cell wall biosynthesis|uniref:glycosyltransferase family 4 protein n=1 Tax=Methanobacterium sp. TaxID=2164 RepID=UPI0003C9D81A|nr:glycosyltransferase family 4 protein [uncultured Methanobacterium sp.]CDG65203.1 hypothetical protein MBMB1_1102 [Methanobacterium sp. MB1]
MKILSVNVGAPTDDYSAWVRKIKIVQLMKSMGYEVDFVIYSWTKHNVNHDILKQIPVHYQIVKVSRFNFFIKHLQILRKKDYDVVFCNGQFTHALLSLTKLKGVCCILDKHGDMVDEFLLLNNGFRYNPRFIIWFIYLKLIDTLNFYFANKTCCVSHKMVERLEERGFNEKNLFYVTNGIDDHFFIKPDDNSLLELKEKLDIEEEDMVFTYLGAFEKWQGVDNFIKAAKSLKNVDGIKFIIVGGADEVIDGNVHLVPKVPQEMVSYYYAISDVLVLPRPRHPATEVAAPTKFPEYMAMEKPILTTNVGDAAVMVENYNCGIVVSDNAPSSLKEGIMQFKNKTKDELKLMGSNSLKLARKEFTMEKMAKDLQNALEN